MRRALRCRAGKGGTLPTSDVDLCSLAFRTGGGKPAAPFHGRHLHAAFLTWLAERDAALATALHQPGLPRPFTVARIPLPNRKEIIRCTLMNRRLIAVVREGLDSGNGGLRLRLASSTHDLVLLDLPAWSSSTTWQALAAKAPPDQDLRLEFVTPTCFSHDLPGERKRLVLFPLPALLWASWARKWQLFGPPLVDQADLAQEAE